MKRKIYHVSKTSNLTMLEPRICSHDKAYVYASYHIETALIFGGDLWSDWDFIYKRDYDTGNLTLSETYVGIFDKTFEGKSCVLYEVEDSGFLEGQTHMWDEIVSENPTRILKETKISNLAEMIRKLEKQNKIKIEMFQNTKEYKEKIAKHILHLKKYSDINKQHNSEVLIREFGELVK